MKESQKLEFKKSLAERKEILETISAFSNTKGGRILVGIEEKKDGSIKEIVGIKVKGKEVEVLVNEIKQNTDPIVFPSMELEKMEEKEVLVIDVKESLIKPVMLKYGGYKRVGKSNLKLTIAQIREMTKESVDYSFTDLVCEGAKLSDFDEKILRRISSSGKTKNLLEAVGSIKKGNILNSGILLFGNNPLKLFPNSMISIAKYRGKNVGTERIDYKEFSGNLFDQIDGASDYVKNNSKIMSRLKQGEIQREDIYEYPFFVIRELIVNAVAHRDYGIIGGKIIVKMFEDRIEYYSPGGLPGKITPQNIVNMQNSRNPVLVRVFGELNYIESLGEGWDRIFEEYKKHPLRPKSPVIKNLGDAVLVTIYAATLNPFDRFKGNLNERQKEFLLEVSGSFKTETYAKRFKITQRQARTDISQLVLLGLLIKEGKARLVKYKLDPEISGNIRNINK